MQAQQGNGRSSPNPDADQQFESTATVVAKTESREEGVHDGAGSPGLVAPVVVAGRANPELIPAPGAATRAMNLTWEHLAYAAIMVMAVVSRFWDLGSKTLHHDESLHAYYSWVYATGGGYEHHPLMHGPFLFHANALVYLLFGDTDATSRYMPALFGVVLAGLPYLLRGSAFLGRWGALAASAFLLISPSILYQSRYIRHDIYTITGTLLLFICIVRYVERPQSRWLVTGAGTIAFLLTNHEIVFAILAIFGAYLYGALYIEWFRRWRHERPRFALALVGIHVAFVAGVALLYMLVPESYRAELLDIPWRNPTQAQERAYYRTVGSNPLLLGFLGLFAAFLLAIGLLAMTARKQSDELLEEAGTVTSAARASLRDKSGLLAAVSAALLIFVPLYTSFFQNMDGLKSSTIATDGTLLYWLGQHDFQRGEQPWFYFLLLGPQYEFLAVLLGGLMTLAVLARAAGTVIGFPAGRNLFFRMFLVMWFALILAGLSYAGEKMPWLVVHIALPAILLAAAFTGSMFERVATWRLDRVGRALPGWIDLNSRDGGLAALLLVIAGAWFWLAARLSYGEFVAESSGNRGGIRRTITDAAADDWWRLAVPLILAAGSILLWMVWRGALRTAMVAMITVVVGLGLLQVHAGWRLAYHEPDVPRDMLVYTQTSPDVLRVMNEIDELSAQLAGGYGLVVWYDSEVSWPFQWYLRNYPNKRFIGSTLSEPPENAPILLLGGSASDAEFLVGYTAQEYVLRWWFPEETYRGFAIAPEINPGRSAWRAADDPHGVLDVLASMLDTAGNQRHPEYQLRLYRLLMYRDLDSAIGQTNFRLYIRNDLIPIYDAIRYGN